MSEEADNLLEGAIEAGSQIAADGKEFTERVAKGENPLSAVSNTLLMKDGRPSLQKLKDHRWSSVTFLVASILTFLLSNPSEGLAFVIGHKIAIIGMIFSFLAGWTICWFFQDDLERYLHLDHEPKPPAN